jgi:hypothetical protein
MSDMYKYLDRHHDCVFGIGACCWRSTIAFAFQILSWGELGV